MQGLDMKKRDKLRWKIRCGKSNHGQKPTLHRQRTKLKTGPKK